MAQESKGLLFSHRLSARAQVVGSWLCVGIDPRVDRLPPGFSADAAGIEIFARRLIAATAPYAAAFKINFAFFEALGPDGWQALATVRTSVPADIPVIADAKRGDIGSTAEAYARAIFDELDFDAVTLSPYLGWDALEPFLNYAGRGLFVLCRTSNPGSGAIQELPVGGEPLYLEVARQALRLSGPAEVGLVVGATHPDALRAVRDLGDGVLLLVPGVGAQGAEAASTLRLAANQCGEHALIPVSREIVRGAEMKGFEQTVAANARALSEALSSAQPAR